MSFSNKIRAHAKTIPHIYTLRRRHFFPLEISEERKCQPSLYPGKYYKMLNSHENAGAVTYAFQWKYELKLTLCHKKWIDTLPARSTGVPSKPWEIRFRERYMDLVKSRWKRRSHKWKLGLRLPVAPSSLHASPYFHIKLIFTEWWRGSANCAPMFTLSQNAAEAFSWRPMVSPLLHSRPQATFSMTSLQVNVADDHVLSDKIQRGWAWWHIPACNPSTLGRLRREECKYFEPTLWATSHSARPRLNFLAMPLKMRAVCKHNHVFSCALYSFWWLDVADMEGMECILITGRQKICANSGEATGGKEGPQRGGAAQQNLDYLRRRWTLPSLSHYSSVTELNQYFPSVPGNPLKALCTVNKNLTAGLHTQPLNQYAN